MYTQSIDKNAFIKNTIQSILPLSVGVCRTRAQKRKVGRAQHRHVLGTAHFLYFWARVRHTPAGKENNYIMVFLITFMVSYILFIRLAKSIPCFIFILLGYRGWNGRAQHQWVRVTPTNGIETIYGKVW